MTNAYVVDTNVAVVASERSPQAPARCVIACIDALSRIQSGNLVVLDRSHLILDEYRRNLSPSGQPGVGDMFFKWIWQNQGNPACCEWVDIHKKQTIEEDFDEFPSDPELSRFDLSDRKFVAAARASPSSPSVMNAVDSDWWTFRSVLSRYGVQVEFLCPDQFDAESGPRVGRSR